MIGHGGEEMGEVIEGSCLELMVVGSELGEEEEVVMWEKKLVVVVRSTLEVVMREKKLVVVMEIE
uniref:Uncharacterized protein n=1 Tax=Nelumbo nucifera TaxID=4432 RepID=A0A822ZA18_NELNU|nr:TPA_asm: hypothetical protein HUJ06_001364 [Nelumbo nucifera]